MPGTELRYLERMFILSFKAGNSKIFVERKAAFNR